jgi:hypothetical protein
LEELAASAVPGQDSELVTAMAMAMAKIRA